MEALFAALALLGGVIGAGFASGREILRFFGVHGRMAFTAAAAALTLLAALFLRLSALMARHQASSLTTLCAARFGARFGRLCSALFALLCAVTGGAMLAACAELGALVLPIRAGYALSLIASLMLGALLCLRGLSVLALPGALLTLLMGALLVRLLALPTGEACFLPAMTPDLPVRAAVDGAAYAALSAAQLCGMLPMLAALDLRARRRAVALFTLLFGLMLFPGILVCRRHLSAVLHQPLPFVYLSRALSAPGYLLLAACMYAAALSTLCAMLRSLAAMLPFRPAVSVVLSSLCCLAVAAMGFDALVAQGYPMLSALCAGLMLSLCLPVCPKAQPPC